MAKMDPDMKRVIRVFAVMVVIALIIRAALVGVGIWFVFLSIAAFVGGGILWGVIWAFLALVLLIPGLFGKVKLNA